MANESTGQDLIADFLETIRLRHLDRCQELLNSLEALSEQQPEFKPWARYMAGFLTFEQNHWAEAEHIFTDLLQTDLEPDLRGHVFYALGRVFDLQGRWPEAITAFEQHLAIATKLGQVVEQARSWNHLALSYNDGFIKGDFGANVLQQAINYGQLALEALETIQDPSSDIVYLQGEVWNTLGLIYVSLRRWAEAIACYEQELIICQAQNDHFGLGITYGNLGEAYLKQGNWPEALKAHQEALTLIREFQGRYEEIDVLANMAFLYQKMADQERALDHYRQTIELIEALRAGISTEAVQAGFFATVVNIYANMILLCLEAGDQAQAFDYVERARSRAFLDTLIARSPVPTETVEAATMPLSAVQAALPADALLLEYFTTGLVEAKESHSPNFSAERHRFPPAKTLLFAVTSTEIQIYDLGLSPNDLRPYQLDSVVERHFLKPAIRRRLYELLLAPAANLLTGKRLVYLAPHGPLHYIPFQALIAPDGRTLLRKAGPQLIYAPSATLLLHRPPVASQVTGTCLALGYNDRDEARLRFAEGEARGIARLTGGQALTGASPKKATLYQQAANYRLLHFSCHGDFDPESPLTSALHIGPDETMTGLDVLEHLHLRCDLVTLSACESGLSRVRRGDELIGFIRAFMYAGTPALVSTLWRVDERSTWLLMERFYTEIEAGLGFAEALKQAQLYLKNLTRREVLDLLVDFSVQETGDVPADLSAKPASRPTTSHSWGQVRSYLKGLTSIQDDDRYNLLVGEDDEKIFADPFYWAPFILVGAHGSELLK